MSIRITVRSAAVLPRHKKNSVEIFAHEQTAYAWLFERDGSPAPYPEKITLTHWVRDGKPETPPYAPGEYTLAPTSFTAGEYGRLDCSPRLVAAQAAAKS